MNCLERLIVCAESVSGVLRGSPSIVKFHFQEHTVFLVVALLSFPFPPHLTSLAPCLAVTCVPSGQSLTCHSCFASTRV